MKDVSFTIDTTFVRIVSLKKEEWIKFYETLKNNPGIENNRVMLE